MLSHILTTLSISMFGERASLFIRTTTLEELQKLTDSSTKIVGTRDTHIATAHHLFGEQLPVVDHVKDDDLIDKTVAIIHYRGLPPTLDGIPHRRAKITYYLIDVEEYLDAVDNGNAGTLS